MKKALAAIAVLGVLTAPAHAQPAVTVYGIADASVVRDSGGTASSVTRVNSGAAAMSRVGFRGTEDLGGGVSALFVLETGFRLDTGVQDVAGTLFNRQAYVGIKSTSMGALTIGRQYTPYYLTLSQVMDPFGGGYAGNAKNLFPASGANVRTSNTVMYVTPALSGFTAELAYAFGEQAGSNSAGGQLGASLGYTIGKLNARIAHNRRNNDLTAAAGAALTPPVPAAKRQTGRNTLIAANYSFGMVRAHAGIGFDTGLGSAPLANTSNPFGGLAPVASTDGRDYLIGASVTMGSNALMASYMRKDDRTFRSQDADQLGLGFIHSLSKRTSLYAAYARIDNKRGAAYTVGNNADVGTGDSSFNLGLRHNF